MAVNTFDFDTPTNRRHSGCYKWDEVENEGVIPMWVADMDFKTAPCIIEALRKRVEHGVFGYTLVGEDYYDAVINWWSSRHNWNVEREWIQYTTGVVPAVSVVIKALTQPGDKVILFTPAYNCFFSCIRNNDVEAVALPLARKDVEDSDYKLFTYEIDFTALEKAASDPKAKVLLFCNPHNPAGRMWTAAEMAHVNDICLRNGVRVISDEIHCELCMPGNKFIPFASVSDACLNNSVICNSPSKSFNTAGLQMANIICNHPAIRERIDRVININEVCDVSPFGPIGVIAAYNEGAPWLDALNEYLFGNYNYLCQFFRDNIPSLSFTKLEGTYLVWVDVSSLGMNSAELCQNLIKEAKVQFNDGVMYDPKNGADFIRINLACPRSQVEEALQRFADYVKNKL